MASVTEEVFDGVIWTVDGDNTRRLEHLAHMIAATSEAARAAARAGDKLTIELTESLVAVDLDRSSDASRESLILS